MSPFKSYRWYWQVEFLGSSHKFNSEKNTTEEVETKVGPNGQETMYVTRKTTERSYSNVDIEVPILMRYNINNYIGVGAGIQGTLSMQEKFAAKGTVEQLVRYVKGGEESLGVESLKEEVRSSSFTNLRKGLLFEVTGGFARIGPSLGARYVMNIESNYNYWQLYAIWKF